MKRWFFILLIFTVLIFGGNNDVFATTIFYDVTNISGNLWEYEYEVVNNTLLDINEFTIWFEYCLYDGLNVTTPVAAWDEITADPDLILSSPDDGFYDAFALVSGVVPGASKSGFSVSFNWLGPGTPGSQFFEIVDPLDSGYTTPFPSTAPIPEPATMFLLASGLTLLGIMRKSYK